MTLFCNDLTAVDKIVLVYIFLVSFMLRNSTETSLDFFFTTSMVEIFYA